MNLQDLEKNAADLQANLDEMKATIMKMTSQPSGLWRPELDEAYFLISSDGDVAWTINEDFRSDKYRISSGNAYHTYQEAERARDKQEVMQRLRELAGGYRFRCAEKNWYLFYNTYTEEWIAGFCQESVYQNEIYFPSKEAALAARDELGPRLDVLLEIEK